MKFKILFKKKDFLYVLSLHIFQFTSEAWLVILRNYFDLKIQIIRIPSFVFIITVLSLGHFLS